MGWVEGGLNLEDPRATLTCVKAKRCYQRSSSTTRKLNVLCRTECTANSRWCTASSDSKPNAFYDPHETTRTHWNAHKIRNALQLVRCFPILLATRRRNHALVRCFPILREEANHALVRCLPVLREEANHASPLLLVTWGSVRDWCARGEVGQHKRSTTKCGSVFANFHI